MKAQTITEKTTNMMRDSHLDWLVLFVRKPLFFHRDIIVKKQTTSIFREPLVDAESKFL